MAENMIEEPHQLKVKEEIIFIQEEILPTSTLEDTCNVYKQEEDAHLEYAEIKGKHIFLS